MWAARGRLASLWGSQVARVFADNALRLLVVLDYAQSGLAETQSAWHLVSALLMLPAILLAPFNGALVNSLPKWEVLPGAALFSVIAVVLCNALGVPLLVSWILIAVCAAVYAPTRSALLPAASEDSRISLPRVNGLFEMGAAAAVGCGALFGFAAGRGAELPLFQPVTWVILVYGMALLLAFPVRFASDVSRPEAARQAVAGFFRDVGRIWREREARWCLFGLASLRGLITGMTGALLATHLADGGADIALFVTVGAYVVGGVALGSLLAGLQKHPRRVLGLVPLGATGLTVGLIIAATGALPGPTLCVVLGVMAGLVNVPLSATYQNDVPPDARGNAMAVRNFADNVLIAAASVSLFALANWAGWGPAPQMALVAALAGTLAVASWWFLRREVVEAILEGFFAIMYRFRTHGPGAADFPLRGPVLVIANHACWMDPMLLGKVLPRTMIPMMTSWFFDLPGLRWMMIYLFDAIRVEASTFRRDVPELKEAVRRLDLGRCVELFPEGWMRRREELILRNFGQGVWHILRERPRTPVVVCWIEGNWGSYFSYKDGPPTKNKKVDFRRHIDIVIGTPHTVPPEILEDHQATRQYLHSECLALRSHLGLETRQAAAVEEMEA
jgi:acyl-[acyl-carrier-protein]-phospholipid O-acyltransferase / long-chain-fatty-acid--[acyl-carrier-protein] ligase